MAILRAILVIAAFLALPLAGLIGVVLTIGSTEHDATAVVATEPPAESELELPLPGYPGCVAEVSQLPPSLLRYEPTDPRLQGDRVIVVDKTARRIMLFSGGKIRFDRAGGKPSCWKVALGVYTDGNSAGVFDKLMEGDRRTPEGWFRTSDRPESSFYHAIMIHYPSERHAAQALRAKRISKATYNSIAVAERLQTIPPQDTTLGSYILIHGGGSSSDWTWGCVALENNDIDELRVALSTGMRTWILILP